MTPGTFPVTIYQITTPRTIRSSICPHPINTSGNRSMGSITYSNDRMKKNIFFIKVNSGIPSKMTYGI
jgi:hypothetical protein